MGWRTGTGCLIAFWLVVTIPCLTGMLIESRSTWRESLADAALIGTLITGATVVAVAVVWIRHELFDRESQMWARRRVRQRLAGRTVGDQASSLPDGDPLVADARRFLAAYFRIPESLIRADDELELFHAGVFDAELKWRLSSQLLSSLMKREDVGKMMPHELISNPESVKTIRDLAVWCRRFANEAAGSD